MDWSITLPGLPHMVRVARKYCWAVFHDTPCAETAELIASELAANALRHTPSGATGGMFMVRAVRRPGYGRIEVTDQGTGRWQSLIAPPDEDEETGRGLLLVDSISSLVGHRTGLRAQTIWAEIAWEEPDVV